MNVLVKGALVGVAVAAFGVVSTAQAQAPAATASIQATAQVQTALTATGVQDLDFGSTFGGIARTVLPTDATSGEFSLLGGADAEVSVTFPVLPANLVDGAANTMPISFGAASGSHSTAQTRAGSTVFNPAVALVTRLDATTGALGIFLGGTVTPAVGQAAGAYAGTIQLSASYTGN